MTNEKDAHQIPHDDRRKTPLRVAPRLEGVVKNKGTKPKKKQKEENR